MSDNNWVEALPEPLRDAPFIGKAESLEDAVGKLAHAAQIVGTSIRIPGEDAPDEDRDAFFAKLSEVPGVARLPTPDDTDGMADLLSKLGRPEEADKYQPPEIENFEWDDNMLADLRQYAHESNLTQAQFKQFAAKIAEQEIAANENLTEQQQQERDAIKQEWGEALEDREALIRGWLDVSDAPDSMTQMLDNKQLPADTLKWLYSIAEQFKDTTNPLSQDRDTRDVSVTPEQAREKIHEILSNPAYFNAADPRQKDLMRDMIKYQKLANPQAAA